jgi:hypothetical protein
MAEPQKYVETFYGPQESYGDIVPDAASFYWKLTPPVKLGFGESTEAGIAGKRIGGFGPAPRLLPITQRATSEGDKLTESQQTPSVHVNIRDLHHWTESPISSRREVPVLNLKEMRILTNPMLNQMANSVFSMIENGSAAWDTFAGIIDSASGDNFDFGQALERMESDKDKSTAKKSEDSKSTVSSGDAVNSSGSVTGALQGNLPESQVTRYSDPMNPYSLLYTTKPTGFKYSLPYMEDSYVSNSGMFGDDASSAGSIVSGLQNYTQGMAKVLQTVNMRKLAAPGKLIEQPKAFTFTGREKSYTVTFPLFNTKSYVEIIRNWQFIYLMSYQNTPNRVNRDLIDPPCIYESYIPGMWYSKYSALTSMTVDFIGARREMYVPIDFLDHADNQHEQQASGNWIEKKRKVLTVIPDAYQVTLTLTELFSETQNMKHQMLRESMNDKIRTGVITR